MSAWLYAAPTAPLASTAGASVSAGAAIAIVTFADVVIGGSPGVESVTITVRGKLPLALGVPDSVPVGVSVSPAGSAPAVTA